MNNRNILRGIPGALITLDLNQLTKVCIQVNHHKIKEIHFSAYRECRIFKTVITSNSVRGQPPLSYYWESLSKEQQKYFAFHLDIFSNLG